MKNIFRISGVILLIILTLSCKKEKVPILTTSEIIDITYTTATCGGIISDEGSGVVIARGVCWSTGIRPTIDDFVTSDGSGAGSFISNMDGLNEATTYYVRAYATNNAGTGYGNELSFTTSQVLPATLTTSSISSITLSSAISGGNITDDGGGLITARGICWSSSLGPTISDTHTEDGIGIGSFTSNLTGLAAGTVYYVRSYATNSAGTAYGNQIVFTTSIEDNEGNIYYTIKIGTQVWMAENIKATKYNDGTDIPLVTDNYLWAALTTPAYCWYNNDLTNKNIYGALYNWFTVNTGKLCPSGWHIPTHVEWGMLATYVGVSLAGGKLKEAGLSHWQSPNSDGTNESGFTALPGGYRFNDDGTFYDLGYTGSWWSSFEGVSYQMYYNRNDLYWFWAIKAYGFSVRCLKD
jgi:uncharacterized protein (TIGR02145 family)